MVWGRAKSSVLAVTVYNLLLILTFQLSIFPKARFPSIVAAKDVLSWNDYKLGTSIPYQSFFKSWTPSISRWENIDMKGHFSVISMHVDHHFESNWYVPALHDKHSVGWNRTVHETQSGRRPYSCTLRFLGVALESTLQGYERGGSGYVTLAFSRENRRMYWHGFDKNETNKVYCYYTTNKDTGSEFLVSEPRQTFSKRTFIVDIFELIPSGYPEVSWIGNCLPDNVE